ncbi:DUF111 family protein [Rhizobium lusitanum]|uniref:DUF111 family protein n=1 Tax=Rhizobium lusitanum TaxID=293958 RepID=A0A6L9U927_9HYPH|nr:LarC family nickel insertion protein [Rhizobium lusitanum]NEI72455.1 DUF111 family protein [Rhizobium lusitanum]
MLELHLDPVGGIAGDMFAAAMLDLRPELEAPLRAALALCPLIEDVRVRVVTHNDGVLTGRRFIVERPSGHAGQDIGLHDHGDHDHSNEGHGHVHAHRHAEEHHDPDAGHHHHHVDWRLISDALSASALDPETIRHALGIFSLLAEAEARVHGKSVNDVQFHEVGAWDSIADIVAAGWLVQALGALRWTVGAIPLGSGRIRSAHGLLAIPAPATTLLLEGFATLDDGIAGERVTPTGAAILRYLCDRGTAHAMPRRLIGSAHGFGTRRLARVSNCLRVLAFDNQTRAMAEQDHIAVLECEIDDQTGEDLAQAVERLRAHPAVLDVVQVPVFGKKGRMMTHVRVLVSPNAVDAVLALAFDETTTIGIRHSIVQRTKLGRTSGTMVVDGRTVAVKQVERPSGPTTKVEADDIADIAGNAGRSRFRLLADAQLAVRSR